MILIFGLGGYKTGSGTAAAFWYARTGERVVVTDMKTADQLHQPTLRKLRALPNVTLVLGKHRKQDIAKARLIVRNPGVPDHSEYIQYAKQLDKPIVNDVAIFLEELRTKFSHQEVATIGVTGTRGKSTTTTLIGEILKAGLGNKRVHVGGNIGKSPLLFLHTIKAGDVVVLELSSWLLRDLHTPQFTVAVVTNLLRDHMNYYSSMATYQKDKERIFLGQTTAEYAVVNPADASVKRMAKRTKAECIWFTPKRVPGMQLRGEHNEYNIGAAVAVASLFGITPAIQNKAIIQFSGVPNRLELIRTYKQREFYNDTTATTPDAAIAALRSFKKKVILIAGGNSKNLPLQALHKEIIQRTKHLLLLPGNANHDFPPGIEIGTIKQAVTTAWQLSKPGDIILLSPGVTWLPVMNEFERGKQFVRYVKQLR